MKTKKASNTPLAAALWPLACLASILMLTAPLRGEQLNDFERYRVILTRQPFGEPPQVPTGKATEGPVVPQGPPQPPFVSEYNLCFIGEGPLGRRVGFVHKKSNKTYYLYVGETSDDGITVLDADYDGAKIKLKKGDEEDWLAMNGAVIGTSDAPAPATAVSDPTGPPEKARPVSYVERLRQRREALRHRTVEPPKLDKDELDKYLKEYQMELIRTGQPPLPMQLTKEMDDQLVSEGVLPPVE